MVECVCHSPAWKHVEEKWPKFKRDPQHSHLELASDGVNPFGLQSTKWSTWPVVLVYYNIPPWLSIKKGNLILSLLIPRKRKVKDMLVFLAPLIEELKDLWKGIEVINNSRKCQKLVYLKGIVLWTMHDYLEYGDVSRYAVAGHHACPICGPNLESQYSNSMKKMV